MLKALLLRATWAGQARLLSLSPQAHTGACLPSPSLEPRDGHGPLENRARQRVRVGEEMPFIFSHTSEQVVRVSSLAKELTSAAPEDHGVGAR